MIKACKGLQAKTAKMATRVNQGQQVQLGHQDKRVQRVAKVTEDLLAHLETKVKRDQQDLPDTQEPQA